VQGIADGDVASGIIGQSPINSGQLTKEEITRCEENPLEVLTLRETVFNNLRSGGRKSGRYTPIARRGDKPDGIAYLLKYYPEITNLQIKKLIGTTDKMIDSIRDRTHWNLKNIKPRDVVLLGLCSQSQFNNIVLKTSDIEGVVEKKKKKSTAKTSKITEKKTAIKKDKVAKTKKKSK
jgi:hypothetical protein